MSDFSKKTIKIIANIAIFTGVPSIILILIAISLWYYKHVNINNQFIGGILILFMPALFAVGILCEHYMYEKEYFGFKYMSWLFRLVPPIGFIWGICLFFGIE